MQPNDTFDVTITRANDKPGRHSRLVNYSWHEVIQELGAYQSMLSNPVVKVEIERYGPTCPFVRQVPSTSSDRVYTVTNDRHCTCPGFQFRGWCKHVHFA